MQVSSFIICLFLVSCVQGRQEWMERLKRRALGTIQRRSDGKRVISIPRPKASNSRPIIRLSPPKPVNHNIHHQHSDPFVFKEAVASAASVGPAIANSLPPVPNQAVVDAPQISKLPSAAVCPQGVRIRKEFRDLDPSEWSRFKEAIKKLYVPDGSGRSIIDRFTRIHLDNADIAHNTAHFLPWHRWFTWLLEEELRKVDSSLAIPYWDWTFDSQSPLSSPIFSPKYLGMKTGRSGDCDWIVSNPKRHCVVRNYDRSNFGSFYGRRTIDRLITDRSMSWSDFAEMFETNPHGIVHTKVGGPRGDLAEMASPNDPMFWVHHSMVDYIWMQRQVVTGRNNDFGGRHRGRRAGTTDELRPFRVKVEDTFDWDRLCYTYQPFSGWVKAGPAALSAGANVSANSTEHIFPDSLPDAWVEMHGWEKDRVKEIEGILRILEAEPLERDEVVADKDILNSNNVTEDASQISPHILLISGLLISILVIAVFWLK